MLKRNRNNGWIFFWGFTATVNLAGACAQAASGRFLLAGLHLVAGIAWAAFCFDECDRPPVKE